MSKIQLVALSLLTCIPSGSLLAQEKESPFWKAFEAELGKAAAQTLLGVAKEIANSPSRSEATFMEMPASYSFDRETRNVNVKIAKIVNQRTVGSRKYQIRLYATVTRYESGGISGYVIAERYFDALTANHQYRDIDFTTTGKSPPTGQKYFITLVLSEDDGAGVYRIAHAQGFTSQANF